MRAFLLLWLFPTLVACSSASFGGGGGSASSTPQKPAATADAKPASKPASKPSPSIGTPPHGTLGNAVAGQAPDPGADPAAGQPDPGTPPPACESLPAGSLIDFEDLGSAGEGASVTNQYAASHGVTFSLEGGGSPQLIAIDGSVPAWFCSSDDCSGNVNGVRSGEQLGHWAITSSRVDANAHASTPLIISYAQPVDEASGMIIDVDRGETYTVEARDAAGNVLDTVTLLPQGNDQQEYDGRGMAFQIQRGGKGDVASIRLQGTKEAWAGGIGLAFDNFSPSKACH